MKIKLLIMLICVGLFACSNVNSNPFIGKWKSNKELTIQEWDKTKINIPDREFLESLLGIGTYEFTNDTWKINYMDVSSSQSYEIIKSMSGCHTIKVLADSGEDIIKICIKNENMFLYIEQFESYEVYSKIKN